MKNSLKMVCIALGISLVLVTLTKSTKKVAASPNGTRPTVMGNLSVVAASSTQTRVSGRLITIDGYAVPGMEVDIYAVGPAYFSRWAVAYTNNAGNFSYTMPNVPTGAKIQIEGVGNGAYSRPYPTFNRP